MTNPFLPRFPADLVHQLRLALERHERQPDSPVLNRTIFLLIDALIQKGRFQARVEADPVTAERGEEGG